MDFIGGETPLVLSEYGVASERVSRNIFGNSKLKSVLSRKLSTDLEGGADGVPKIGLPSIRDIKAAISNGLNY